MYYCYASNYGVYLILPRGSKKRRALNEGLEEQEAGVRQEALAVLHHPDGGHRPADRHSRLRHPLRPEAVLVRRSLPVGGPPSGHGVHAAQVQD